MHVGLIAEHSDPARGGAERYVAALVERLRAHGHEATLFSRTGPQAQPVASFPPALRPRHYASAFLPRLRELGAVVVLATAPVPGCDFFQPHNGILGASIPPHLDPLPWGLRHLRRINPFRVAHFAVLSSLEARAVAPPATVLALSPRVVTDLHRFHPRANATLLRPGVDLDRFAPAAGRSRGRELLFVAKNPRLKGLPTVRGALRHLPGARLVVAGDGDDLPALYRRADVLVHPTWYDTASLVVLEALASGTPPITTTRDGNADLAEEGGGAVLSDPGDARALARAVEEVLARADAGRARAVAERFCADAMLDRVVETLCAS